MPARTPRELDLGPAARTVELGADAPSMTVLGVVVGGDEALRRAYRADPVGFPRRIDGSFVLALHDADRLRVVTDRTNSRRIYVNADGQPRLARRPDLVWTSGRLDPAGVGSYLANGYVLCERSVYGGVAALGPATDAVVDVDGLRADTYWHYGVEPDRSRSRVDLEAELADLLVRAVDRRVGATPWLSLSAGFDARGILGILRWRLGRDDVRTFSYAHGDPTPDTDAGRSADLARAAGYPHTVVPAYDGDLVGLIESNATLGRATSNLCEEVAVWTSSIARDGDLVVGDESFGWSDMPITDLAGALDLVYLRDGRTLSRLRRLEDRSGIEQVRAGADDLLAQVAGLASTEELLHDAKDEIYFGQRLTGGLMRWRECFAGAGRTVHNPYLDADILEFVRRLPVELRLGKRLYRDVIRSLVPEAFEVPLARVAGVQPDWPAELAIHERHLLDRLAEPSPLDELIAPDAVATLVRRASRRTARAREQVERVRVGISRRSPHAQRVLGAPIARPLPDHLLALRVLVLRRALQLAGDPPPADPPGS